jgi:hypothetical protein
MLHERAELIEMVNEKLTEAGMELIEPGRPPLITDVGE